ncbi:hypothetical protein WSM22_38550 [Cytophagales bacterium WSM2-2]|nr:hypothetical protein WSM22_38550 [Cytophagales bacterium WSM2-2]
MTFLLALTINKYCEGQAPSVEVKYQVAKGKGKFLITLQNPANDSIVFWIQNWRMALVDSKNERLHGFPFTGGLLNFFIITNDSLDLNKQLSSVEYSTTSVGWIQTPCLKVLGRNSYFQIEINTKEKRLIEFMKQQNKTAFLVCSFAKWDNLRSISGIRNFIFSSNKMVIDKLLVGKNSTNDISSSNFNLGPKRENKLYFKDLKKVFEAYLTKKIRIS